VGPLTQARARPRSRGFTLIELLVVVVIAGIALAMVALQGIPSTRSGLRFEAERLAQLLVLARDEAQVRGQALRLQADESGYAFQILRERQWRPLTDDQDLRPREWDAPTRLLVLRPDGRRDVEFGRDAVDAPFSLQLSRDGDSVAILANGLGQFEVR